MLSRRVLTILVVLILSVLGAIAYRSGPDGSWSGSTTPVPVFTVEQKALKASPLEKGRGLGDVLVSNDDDEISDDEELARRGKVSPVVPTLTAEGLPGGGRGPLFLPATATTAQGPDRDSESSSMSTEDIDGRTLFTDDEADPRRKLSDGTIFGARIRGPSSTGAGSESVSGEESFDNDSSLPWVSGQARGYTMLYAMQPAARQVVERNVEALLRSRLREPYIGVLIDGTFGRDFEYLQTIIRRLSSDGRTLTLVLYLTNGATMRKWREVQIRAPFVNIEPIEFRNLIRRDRGVRDQFQRIARDAQGIFQFSQQTNPGNRNFAIVMLEDNLNRQAYGEMRSLAKPSLDGVAAFVRNPCIGCYRGNDMDSLGDSREEHAIERFPSLASGDAYSLDGQGFSYPGQPPGPELSAEQLLGLMPMSYERGLRWVGLWRHAWQGLIPGQANPHPDARNYLPSAESEIEFEIDVLRLGLPVEATPPE